MDETWQHDKGLQEKSDRQMAEVIRQMSKDAKALDWIHKHGGIEQVKMDWEYMANLDKYQLDVARKLGISCEGLDAQDTQKCILDKIDELQNY